MPKVKSSNIDSVSYERTTKVMTIVFLNGTAYTYAGVPEQTYRMVLNAPSVGKAYEKLIKGGGFAFNRIY